MINIMRKWLIAVVLLGLFLVIFFVKIPHQRMEYVKTPARHNYCDDPLTFAYLRLHKTGSTTLWKLLAKYKENHAKKTQTNLVSYPFPFLEGYPGLFHRNLTVVRPASSQPQRADFAIGHFRFNREEVKAVMNPKAKFVTMMRVPFHQFESAYYYWYGRFKWGKLNRPVQLACWEYPYIAVTDGNWVNFPEYIKLAGEKLNETVPWFFRSYNSQSYELGLDPLRTDEGYVLMKAKEINESFDLVLIFEHFLESIVLLKDLLCADWKNILPPPVSNSGGYKRREFSTEEETIVKKLTSQDRIMYDYFNASFWRKVDAYGRKQMAQDVATLRKLIGPPKNSKPQQNLERPATRQKVPQRQRAGTPTEAKNIASVFKEFKSNLEVASTTKAYELAEYMAENHGWCPSKL